MKMITLNLLRLFRIYNLSRMFEFDLSNKENLVRLLIKHCPIIWEMIQREKLFIIS